MDYSRLNPADMPRLDKFAEFACSTKQGVYLTFLLLEEVIRRQVPGVFVECGVAYGAMIATMTHALAKHLEDREIHLFDSFQGIPLAGPRDESQPGFGLGTFLADRDLPLRDRLKTSEISACTEEQVRKNLADWVCQGRLVFHAGWFQDTLPDADVPPIAFLRLDGDLYESTLCCLEHLYNRVSPGGCVYLDDYSLPGCRRAFEDFFGDNAPAIQEEKIYDGGTSGPAYWFTPLVSS